MMLYFINPIVFKKKKSEDTYTSQSITSLTEIDKSRHQKRFFNNYKIRDNK